MKGSRPELLRPEDLRRIADLGLVARWIVEGTLTGLHRSPYHGFSVEFAEYREYAKGDDLRHFDWKVYGRSDRRCIRKYHSETNLACHIVLDASASMGYGDPTKFHYARCLAAAIAYLLEGQKDAFGLVLADEGIRERIPPAVGPSHLRRVHAALEAARPSSGTRIAAALHELAEGIERRGLAVLLSDLYGDEREIAEAIRHLRFEGHEVIAFHVLDPSELDLPFEGASEFEDLETGESVRLYPPAIREEYARRVAEWIDELRRACESCRADFRTTLTSEPFAAALAEYLHRRRLRREL